MTRRIIRVLPYPDRIVKRVNESGKTPRGETYSDGVKFLNRSCEPFDWENEELTETLTEAEEPVYPDVLAKVPGPQLESDLTDEDDTVTAPVELTFEEEAAAALATAGVRPESQLRKITQVHHEMTGVDDDTVYPVAPPLRLAVL